MAAQRTTCTRCGSPLSQDDQEWNRGECQECIRPEGKVKELWVKLKTDTERAERLPHWPQIAELGRRLFDVTLPDDELLKRIKRWWRTEHPEATSEDFFRQELAAIHDELSARIFGPESSVRPSSANSDGKPLPLIRESTPVDSDSDCSTPHFEFTDCGETFRVSAFGLSSQFRKLIGFRQLAILVQRPAQLVSMTELVAGSLERQFQADHHSYQEAIDSVASKQLKEEFDRLMRERSSAEKNNDAALKDSAIKQIEQLGKHLSSTIGPHGRPRDLNQPANKLRPRIHGSLKTAYDHLRNSQPSMKRLAEHFEISIHAADCSFYYAPEGDSPDWHVDKK